MKVNIRRRKIGDADDGEDKLIRKVIDCTANDYFSDVWAQDRVQEGSHRYSGGLTTNLGCR